MSQILTEVRCGTFPDQKTRILVLMQSKIIVKGLAACACQLLLWLPVQPICSQPVPGDIAPMEASENTTLAWHVTSVPGWFRNTSQIAFGGFRVTSHEPGKPHITRKRYRVEGERIVERTEARESGFMLENQGLGAIGVVVKRKETKRANKSFSIGLAWSSEEEEGIDIIPEWHKDEQLISLMLAAELTLASPGMNTWNLLPEGSIAETEYPRDMVLISGPRTIRITPYVSEDYREEFAGLRAEGYEFFEGDTSLASLQFLKNATGSRTSVIRMRRNLNPELQLVLSASVVLLLQEGF